MKKSVEICCLDGVYHHAAVHCFIYHVIHIQKNCLSLMTFKYWWQCNREACQRVKHLYFMSHHSLVPPHPVLMHLNPLSAPMRHKFCKTINSQISPQSGFDNLDHSWYGWDSFSMSLFRRHVIGDWRTGSVAEIPFPTCSMQDVYLFS